MSRPAVRTDSGSQVGPGLLSVGLCVVVAALVLAFVQSAAAEPVAQITEFSSGLNQSSYSTGIAPGSDGNLWFTELAAGAIGRITPQGQITEFTGGFNAGSYPLLIALGPDGNMWFNDRGTTPAVGRITPQGQITEFASGLNPGSLPSGIALGPDGNVWFTDQGTTPAIGRITPDGRVTEFSSGLNSGSGPFGIALGADGNLWFTDRGTTPAIGRITPQAQITEFASGLNPGSYPTSIVPGADGNLWFTDKGTTAAVARITPQGQITEFTSGLNPGSLPSGITPGADGNVWFTDMGTTPAVGRITSQGQITEFTSGLNAGSRPWAIAPGSDGNLWFTDRGSTRAVGRVGLGVPATVQAMPAISGSGVAGSALSCQNGQWATWTGLTPSSVLFGFDGYQWLRDGAPIAGQSASTYTPTAADAGQQLACTVTVTYPLPLLVSALATSNPITAQAAQHTLTVSLTGSGRGSVAGPAISCPPTCEHSYPDGTLAQLSAAPQAGSTFVGWSGGGCSGTTTCTVTISVDTNLTATFTANPPALAALTVSPRRFVLRGRLVKGRCLATTHANQRHPNCTRPISLTISYKLIVPARVTFTIRQQAAGRRVKGRCVPTNRTNQHQPRCTRVIPLPGSLKRTGHPGTNSFTFNGKLAGHKLTPGSYQLTATPTANGRTGTMRSTNLQIVG